MIEFEATFGDDKKQVKLLQPHGTGGNWHVYIDNYYKGSLLNIGGEWAMYDTDLTLDDIHILVDMIKKPDA